MISQLILNQGSANTAYRFRGVGTGGRCRGAGSGSGLQLRPSYATSKPWGT